MDQHLAQVLQSTRAARKVGQVPPFGWILTEQTDKGFSEDS